MYYEEKIINGVLMCRSRPDGDWEQCSINQMSERIMTLERVVSRLQSAVDIAKSHGEDSEQPFYKMMELLNENSSELKE